jgi:hypothetical protein
VLRSKSEWEEKSAALEKLFRDLPICTTATGIPYESLIPGVPRQLLLMRPGLSRSRSKIGAKKGLHILAQSAHRAVAALDSLSQSALAALSYQPAALQRLKTDLRILAAAAREGKVRKAGRPKQDGPSQATKIARAVAQHYCGLTNKAPTAHDQRFVELLSAVYADLGVKAKARSQAMTLSAKINRQK